MLFVSKLKKCLYLFLFLYLVSKYDSVLAEIGRGAVAGTGRILRSAPKVRPVFMAYNGSYFPTILVEEAGTFKCIFCHESSQVSSPQGEMGCRLVNEYCLPLNREQALQRFTDFSKQVLPLASNSSLRAELVVVLNYYWQVLFDLAQIEEVLQPIINTVGKTGAQAAVKIDIFSYFQRIKKNVCRMNELAESFKNKPAFKALSSDEQELIETFLTDLAKDLITQRQELAIILEPFVTATSFDSKLLEELRGLSVMEIVVPKTLQKYFLTAVVGFVGGVVLGLPWKDKFIVSALAGMVLFPVGMYGRDVLLEDGNIECFEEVLQRVAKTVSKASKEDCDRLLNVINREFESFVEKQTLFAFFPNVEEEETILNVRALAQKRVQEIFSRMAGKVVTPATDPIVRAVFSLKQLLEALENRYFQYGICFDVEELLCKVLGVTELPKFNTDAAETLANEQKDFRLKAAFARVL